MFFFEMNRDTGWKTTEIDVVVDVRERREGEKELAIYFISSCMRNSMAVFS